MERRQSAVLQHAIWSMLELDVEEITALQDRQTVGWHADAPLETSDGLLGLVEQNHRRNFDLWHEEDQARREDRGFEHVYRAKRAIDRYNQQRNDLIERIDDAILGAAGPFEDDRAVNSETPGMIIDRLSILALKAYHMDEQARREDADAEHRSACAAKLSVIEAQRRDLAAALARLFDDFNTGSRGFRVYRQFKMYNDPDLNPQLRGSRREKAD